MFFSFAALTIFLIPLVKSSLRISRGQKSVKTKYQCAPDFIRHPENVSVTYRALQLLTKQMSLSVGPFTPITQALMGQIAITARYIFTVQLDSMDAQTFVGILGSVPINIVSWAGFLSYAGEMQRSSAGCVRSWKHGGGDRIWSKLEVKYMAKFSKSSKPLFFGYPGMMTITHKTAVKYVQGIVRGVFRTVLTLKK